MALQDLTPQLRTRLNRTEKAAGWFVLIAVVLLVVGLSYYLYQTAKSRGWFIPKVHYETGINDASGLIVGAPVQLMGENVGQITAIVPNKPDAYFGMTVFFDILKPHYGYIWADSVVKVQATFLNTRYLEVTKGKVGMPTVVETNDEIAALFIHKNFRDRQKALLAAGTNADDIWKIVKAEAAEEPTNFYERPSDSAAIWISPDEAPSLNDRADKLVSQVEAALPNILALTNTIARVLVNTADLTSNLNAIAVNMRPAVSNLNGLTSELRGPGALGTWALGDTNISKVGTTLDTANLTLAHTDTNLTAALESLALITSNLNAQVQANSNMLTSISKIVVDTDTFVQGLKRHWLLRSAFKKENKQNSK
jgi:ABC-type transporter Mla subunit MlaD